MTDNPDDAAALTMVLDTVTDVAECLVCGEGTLARVATLEHGQVPVHRSCLLRLAAG